jgi:hypothetical protein
MHMLSHQHQSQASSFNQFCAFFYQRLLSQPKVIKHSAISSQGVSQALSGADSQRAFQLPRPRPSCAHSLIPKSFSLSKLQDVSPNAPRTCTMCYFISSDELSLTRDLGRKGWSGAVQRWFHLFRLAAQHPSCS